MDEQTGSTEVGAEGSAPTEKTLANIVRGTIPLALVYLIRFDEKDAKDADVAKKYGTTTGKVADIKKGRNFGYVDMDYVPTADDKQKALAWLKQVPNYDTVGTDVAVSAIERMNTASDADAEALKAKRAAIRAKNEGASGDGTPKAPKEPKAPKGGSKGKGEAKATSKADADALMS
jgi:hypothetical protein